MQRRTCCFTGHRVQTLPWGHREEDPRCIALKTHLREYMVALIKEEGVRHFISGMALGVDTYGAELVLELRREGYPVTLECSIPFPGQASRWGVEARRRYERIRSAADRETMIQERYSRGCFHRRSRYMVDQCDFLLAVWDGRPKGGTADTVAYARRRGTVSVLVCPP